LTLNTTAVTNNSAASGGGVSNSGTARISASLIATNTVSGSGGGLSDSGSAVLLNTTVSGNSASTHEGGGIAVTGSGAVTLYNGAVSANSAASAGGLAVAVGARASLANTILAANAGASNPDCSGALTSQGYNILGDTTGCTLANQSHDQVGGGGRPVVDPRLGPLQDNGGPTQTHALLPGSTAVNAGNVAGCSDDHGNLLPTDQRGFLRPDPITARCDIGAHEAQILYADPAGNSGADCLYPTSPCPTITSAIDKAHDGDTIKVAAGTYAEPLTLTKSVTIQGAGSDQTFVDGGDTAPVLQARASAAAVTDLTLQHGRGAAGGGVDNSGGLTLANTVIMSNTSALGGGINNTGALTLTTSALTGNQADRSGGAAANSGTMSVISSTVNGNRATADGAGFYNEGMLGVTASTVYSNTATGNGGAAANASTGALTFVNSTLDTNSAVSGGAITTTGVITLYSATVSGNSASGGAGGVTNALSGTTFMANTILATNTGAGANDCAGTLTSGGYNLLGDTTGCALAGQDHDKVGGGAAAVINPRLYPLHDNGGPTLTRALARLSPAVNAGNPGGCTDASGGALASDQRGYQRPFPTGGFCDIGAYEYQSAVPVVAPTATPGDTATPAPTTIATLPPTPTWTPAPSVTPRPTQTAAPTDTPADTPTTGPTAAPTQTPNSSACLSETIGGWYFEATDCANTPGYASDVRVVAPGGLGLHGSIPAVNLPGVLSGGHFTLNTPVVLPNISVQLPSSGPAFTLAAQGDSVDATGLRVMTATVSLPSVFGGAALSGHNLQFGADGTLGSGVAVTPDPLTFNLGQLGVSAGALTLSAHGVSAGTLTVTLPANLAPDGIAPTLTGHNIMLNSDGTFSGDVTLPDTHLSLDGFTVALQDLTLSRTGIHIGAAQFAVPSILQATGPLTLTGHDLSVDTEGSFNGSLSLSGVNLTLAGYGARTSDIYLDDTGLWIDEAVITLPAVFNLPEIPLYNIALSPDGSVSGTVAVPDVGFSIHGFSFGWRDTALTRNGVEIGTLTLGLPSSLGGKTLTGCNIFVNADGSFGGSPGDCSTPPLVAQGGAVHLPARLGDATVSLAGFTTSIQGLTLSTSGIGVMTATTTLPDALQPDPAHPISVVGTHLAIGATGVVTGSLIASVPRLTVSGFSVTPGPIILDQSGLTVSSVSFNLPSTFGGAGLTGVDIHVAPDGSVSGSVTVTPRTVNFTLGALAVSASGVTLTRDGVMLDALTITLPTGDTLSGHGIALKGDGTFGKNLTLDDASLTVAGFPIDVSGLTLSTSGVTIAAAYAALTPPHGAPIDLTGQYLSVGRDGALGGSLSVAAQTLSVASFTINTGTITLDKAGVHVDDASLGLPSSIFPAGSTPPTLHGSLGIMPNYAITGTLTTGPLSIAEAGFTVAADGVTLDNTRGLTIDNARLSLPSTLLPAGVSAPTLQGNLSISPKFAISGDLTTGPLSINESGFSLSTDGLTLDSVKGLTIANARLALPAALFPSGVSAPSLTGNLSISPQFAINGSLTTGPLSINEAGFTLTTDGLTLASGTGLTIANAQLTLPADIFPAGVTPPTFRGNLAISPKFAVSGQLIVSGTRLRYDGFSLSVQDFTLDQSGVNVDGVSLTLPGLAATGSDITLNGALSITKDAATGKLVVDGHIDIPRISLSAYNFTLSATGITLSRQGLTVGTATLDLAGLGLGDHTLSITGLQVSPSFQVSGGIVSVDGSSTLTLSLDGAAIALSNLSIGSVGVTAGSVTFTLPDAFGSRSFAMNDLTITKTGEVKGSVTGANGGALSLALSDFSIAAASIDFDSKTGVKINNAALGLPLFQGTISVGSISYDGAAITMDGLPALPTNFTVPGLSSVQVNQAKVDCKAGGGTYLPMPPVNAGGFNISGSGCLIFGTDAAGQKVYDIIGRGSVTVADIGNLNALIEIGTVEDGYPSPLRHAALDVQVSGAGIPIDETGLEINGINGQIYIAGQRGAPTYTLSVGLDFQTDDGGYLFKGSAQATFATDGNVGIGGSGTFFTFLPIAGGFCVRTALPTYVDSTGVTRPFDDHVCENSLTHHGVTVDHSIGTGFFAEVSSDLVIHINRDISFHADAYGHIWVDQSGPELAATADMSLNLPESAFLWEVPPCGITAGAGIEVGKFTRGSDTVRGFKGSVSLHVCSVFDLNEDIFVDDSGNVHLNEGSNYTLIDTGNQAAYLLTRAADGQVAMREMHGVAAPTRAQQMVVPVTVVPGQTATLVNLIYRAGAPALSVTAPDGTVYDQNHVGAGNAFYRSAGASGLPAGFSGGQMLFLPKLQSGLWHVTIGNLHGGEGYRLLVQGKTPPPALNVDAPAAGQTMQAAPSVTLSGALTGQGTSGATVSLYETTSPTTVIDGKTLPNYAGTLIAAQVPVHNGRWQYRWDTSTLPGGAYSVYAVLDNGTGRAVNAYARGQVRVIQPARPDAPQDVAGVQSGAAASGIRQFAVAWSPPARKGIVAGYRVHWRTNKTPKGVMYTEQVGEATTYTLNETELGVAYTVSVSSYDLAGHESVAVPAGVVTTSQAVQQGAGPDFRVTAGRGALQAGGFVAIPLSITLGRGKATHGPADVVALSVSAPSGVLARTSQSEINLFARTTSGTTPTVRVFTASNLRPGAYPLVVTARQTEGNGTERVRSARAILIVRPGEARVVTMQAGQTTRAANGLRSVPIIARVRDGSGAPVADGTLVSLSSPDGALQPSTARTRDGVVRATLTYVPGTRPVITADALTALGSLYLGPTPRGAALEHFFAASEGQAARAPASPALREEIVLHNPLPADAHVRVYAYTAPLQPGQPLQSHLLTIALHPNDTVTQRLTGLDMGYPLVGLDVRSDIPITARRVARTMAGELVGTATSVTAPHASYRFGRLTKRQAIDLFNPTGRRVAVRVVLSGTHGGPAMSQTVTLDADGSARIDLGPIVAGAFASHTQERFAATVTAGGPIVAQVDPAPRLPAAPLQGGCVGVTGLLPSCAKHYVGGPLPRR